MIKIAIANMKGGVGKSVTTMMLADALALHHEKNVLVVDCDPQANVSQMMLSFSGLKSASDAGKTLTRWLEATSGYAGDGSIINTPLTAIETHHHGISELSNFQPGRFFNTNPPAGSISIWPATPNLRFAELMFDHLFYSAGDKASARARMGDLLDNALLEFTDLCDVVIFDCPPGFSTLAQAALTQSDLVISPVNVDRVSLWSVKTFWNQALDDVLKLTGLERRIIKTMVRKQGGAEQRQIVRNQIADFASGRKLSVEIPFSVQALKFVHLPAQGSTRSFNQKYGSLKDRVDALGKEVMKILN